MIWRGGNDLAQARTGQACVLALQASLASGDTAPLRHPLRHTLCHPVRHPVTPIARKVVKRLDQGRASG